MVLKITWVFLAWSLLAGLSYAQDKGPVIGLPRYELSKELTAKLSDNDRKMFTALLNVHIESAWEVLSNLGFPRNFTNQVHPTDPEMRLVGRARTLEMLPGRKDLAVTLLEPSFLFRTIDAANPGDVLVFAMGGMTDVGAGGDVTTTRFLYRGGAGMIFDGAIHDLSLIRLYGLPVFARNAHTSALQGRLIYTRADVPVNFAGVTILPGDILYGNVAGLLVIPKDLVRKVIDDSREQDLQEKYLRMKLRQGAPLIGTYPPNQESLKGFEEWKKQQRDDP